MTEQVQTFNLNIDALPLAIDQAATRLASMDCEYTEVKAAIAAIEIEVLSSVAFDKDLKNDDQRKVRKAEALEAHQGYQALNDSLLTLSYQRASCAALLERLRSELSIGKLRLQLAIATAQATSSVEV